MATSRTKDMKEKDKITLVWEGHELSGDDCEVIFKDKFDKEYKVELSRLIKVFNNNIWQHKKSIK
jgi:hypothetical protein|tara:strand:+ start:2868 stop:3062 length:195 start_codon:yes stop_codon:yes gene_type:complete